MTLKELRISKNLSQVEISQILNISLRTYQRYEKDESRLSKHKYDYIYHVLGNYNKIDEEHGTLNIDDIKKICSDIFSKYDIHCCYLFGSYAKGLMKETSDIDLFIISNLTGIKYFELIEELRENLHKKIDLINQDMLRDNFDLTLEILKDGIKIY